MSAPLNSPVLPVEITANQTWFRATGFQRAMIFATLKSDVPCAYLQQLIVRIREPIDIGRFAEAVRRCLNRHDAVMARFAFREGELFVARVSGDVADHDHFDLREGKASREERLRAFLERDRLNDLPLLQDQPLWRSAMVELAPDDIAWIWTHHHALCDGASYRPLLVEIFENYDLLCAGRNVQRSAASPGFFDYLSWLETLDIAHLEAAWRRRLESENSLTALPEIRGASRSLSAGTSNGIKRMIVEIADDVESRLRILCRELDVTLNTIVLSAIGLWLARMQDAEKSIVAVMRDTRRSYIGSGKSIIGPLLNTMPIAIPVRNDVTVEEWLKDVRRDWIDGRGLEHCSLADVTRWTGLQIASELPVVINFQIARFSHQLRVAGLPPERCDVTLAPTTDVPLMINGFATPKLDLQLVWRLNQVSDAVGRACARGLGAAFRAIAADSRQLLGAVDLLDSQDRAALEIANRGPRFEVPEVAAQEFIERQIRHHPNALAMKQGGRELTYRAFSDAAENVARAVASAAKPGSLVAVLLPATPDVVCCMLGILRAGSAFFLINPASPVTEWSAILRHLGAALAITDESLAKEVEPFVPRVLGFEEIRLDRPGHLPSPKIRSDDLAYLVHTSGSTGEKKFVEITHRSLCNTLAALIRTYGVSPGDRRISRAMPGPDYFITETLVALSAGAALVFPERCGAMSLSEFVNTLHREKITVTGIPASYWHEWVREMRDDARLPPHLRLVISSMERASPKLLAKWCCIAGDKVHWLNAYGPAEATIVSTVYQAGDEAATDPTNVPIGRPIGNTDVYVLDTQLRRVPPGIVGELAIAGVGVARGYYRAEKATRQKFVHNPHASAPQFDRLYLTGDYGYVDSCSQLVLVGRRDQQVKVRGYRIELGEIEAVLQEHAHVRDAVLTAEGEDGERRLVAHLVISGIFDPAAMRNWVHGRLPPHLRPADFVTLERFPILATGKVDRRALSAAYGERSRMTPLPSLKGANPIEDKLLMLWTELLGRHQPIARADSFFDLGGNSLLAVRLLSRIEKDFNVALTLHDLFTHPSVAELSSLLQRDPASGQFTSLIRLNSGGPGRPLFIVHGWSGGVFHCLDFARRLAGIRPVFGVQAIEHAGKGRHRSYQEMAAHYADEITRSQPNMVYDLFGHSLGGMIAYATSCELLRRGCKLGFLYLVDTTPLNLPRRIHLRHVLAELRPRVVPNLQLWLRTPLSRHYDFFRARRQSFKARLRRWPSLRNPMRNPLPPDADYYDMIGRDFVPRRAPINVKLFTPSDEISTAAYWRYLTGGRVHNFPIESGHIDMFELGNLDNFMTAFERASRPDTNRLVQRFRAALRRIFNGVGKR